MKEDIQIKYGVSTNGVGMIKCQKKSIAMMGAFALKPNGWT